MLLSVKKVELECQAANIDENDYTVFTTQDLAFELELVQQSISKKLLFIDNQVRFTLDSLKHWWYIDVIIRP